MYCNTFWNPSLVWLKTLWMPSNNSSSSFTWKIARTTHFQLILSLNDFYLFDIFFELWVASFIGLVCGEIEKTNTSSSNNLQHEYSYCSNINFQNFLVWNFFTLFLFQAIHSLFKLTDQIVLATFNFRTIRHFYLFIFIIIFYFFIIFYYLIYYFYYFLNTEFSSLCQQFIDNKLLIHFGEDKTKSILFSKMKGLREINISFASHSIKQHEPVEYLGCQLDSKLSGEVMASKVLKKLNAKLKFQYRQSRYLTPAYRRLLCTALIQPHFDYGCSSWFPLLKKNLKLKL